MTMVVKFIEDNITVNVLNSSIEKAVRRFLVKGSKSLRTRHVWTEEEDLQLAEMFEQGKTVMQIAGELKFTPGSIYSRLADLRTRGIITDDKKTEKVINL